MTGTAEPMVTNTLGAACRLCLSGQVQGVGFRPFVYRSAKTFGIQGWVRNTKGKVVIYACGEEAAIRQFVHHLLHQAPPIARPVLEYQVPADPQEAPDDFTIRASRADEDARIHVPPDYCPCPDCIRELADPGDRRYRYPFINCTQCGPRYTLIHRLPYDRANTSMADFELCAKCRREYHDPADRRFHAEPLACPACGPRLTFATKNETLDDTQQALSETCRFLRAGKIVAIKGIGGYHLVCDARNDDAVRKLRQRKARPHKPFAVMFPPQGDDELDQVRRHAILTPAEARLLRDPARPIVLLERKPEQDLSVHLAPDLKQLGVFLPCSPLHYLLLRDFAAPLVATSANHSGEPVLTDNTEAEQRLARIADAFLHHDRRILRPADDSLYRTINHRPRPLRLGRGISPLELELPCPVATLILATGGQMKNTVALAWDRRLVVSPHIGELDSPRAMRVFEQTIGDLQDLYEVEAAIIACDAHPDYRARRWAQQRGKPVYPVFHHHAHASALVLENRTPETAQRPWLVFTWDGTGYGEDGALQGGEALFGRPGAWRRVASFRPFHLPGGERAGREPWRSAAALCWEAGLDYRAPREHDLIKAAWDRRLNCPPSTAVGRLFDAAAALTGLLEYASFEGQGPIRLEARAEAPSDAPTDSAPLPIRPNRENRLEADWRGLLPLLRDDSLSIAQRSSRFHGILAATLLEKAVRLRERHGEFCVGLSGGVFQNRLLTEHAVRLLQRRGFAVYLHKRLPCNDAGLSAGQVMEVASQLSQTKSK